MTHLVFYINLDLIFHILTTCYQAQNLALNIFGIEIYPLYSTSLRKLLNITSNFYLLLKIFVCKKLMQFLGRRKLQLFNLTHTDCSCRLINMMLS